MIGDATFRGFPLRFHRDCMQTCIISRCSFNNHSLALRPGGQLWCDLQWHLACLQPNMPPFKWKRLDSKFLGEALFLLIAELIYTCQPTFQHIPKYHWSPHISNLELKLEAGISSESTAKSHEPSLAGKIKAKRTWRRNVQAARMLRYVIT